MGARSAIRANPVLRAYFWMAAGTEGDRVAALRARWSACAARGLSACGHAQAGAAGRPGELAQGGA